MDFNELKQEAEEYIKNNYVLYSISGNDIELISQAYLAGAEPREKRIAELEQENKKLKADNDARKFAMAMSEKVEKQLREEVAELEAENKDLPTIAYMQGAEKQKKKDEEQLNKAREIIRSLYFVIQSRINYKGNIPLEDEMYRAEQFLSEVEK